MLIHVFLFCFFLQYLVCIILIILYTIWIFKKASLSMSWQDICVVDTLVLAATMLRQQSFFLYLHDTARMRVYGPGWHVGRGDESHSEIEKKREREFYYSERPTSAMLEIVWGIVNFIDPGCQGQIRQSFKYTIKHWV